MKDAGRIGFVIRGPYSALEKYEFLDIVYYGDASYVAKKDVSGVAPEDESEHWQAFAKGWNSAGAVTGVKGAQEIDYRYGNVSLTPENIGALPALGKAFEASAADKVAHPLTFTGWETGAYDGSASKSVEIPIPVSVKGEAEEEYRTGEVNITKENIGLGRVENMTPEEIRAGLTSEEVETALGYSPSDVTITVDGALDETSENPVQNKAIAGALAGKGDALVYDEDANELHLKSGDRILSTVTIEGGSGGGMKLAGPTGVTLTNVDEAVIIRWADPADIVIEGATQAAWAGTLVVRKVGSAPTSKTDGTIVVDSKTRDAYKETGFTDNGLTNGLTYYYGIFPYTTEKAYTYGTTKSIAPQAIYPSALIGVMAQPGDEEVIVSFEIPEDATRAKVSYSAQRPESVAAPYGTVVSDVESPYVIRNISNDVAYYITAYATNAKGRDTASDMLVITPAAIYPDPPSDASVRTGDGTLTVSFSLPENATSAKIAYSAQRPESVAAPYGTVISNAESPYTIAGLENETEYYVTVYSTNAKGRDAAGEMMAATPTETVLFGFVIDQNESDPDSMITYIEGNANFVPAHMDYANDRFDYGSWTVENGAWFMDVKPCMLNYDGTVAYYLNPNDYTKKIDGTPSDVANADFPGNAMVQFPKVYWKVVDNGDNTANIYFCDRKLDDDFACWSHLDADGYEIEYCYMPVYPGTLVGNRLRSLSGNEPTGGLTYGGSITYAENNNLENEKAWHIEVISDRMLINLLLLLIGGNTDTQKIFGNGACNTAQIMPNGALNALGLFWGDQTETSGVKVFGMEHLWGNTSRRTSGLVNDHGTQKIKMTHSVSDGTSAKGYNAMGDGYLPISGSTPTGNWGGYINKCLFSKFGILPIESKGSATTYYADALFFDNSSVVPCLTGSDNYRGKGSGAFTLNIYYTGTGDAISSALSCKPMAHIGGEL